MRVLLFKYETSFSWKLAESQDHDPTLNNPGGVCLFLFLFFGTVNTTLTAIEMTAVLYNCKAKGKICTSFQI